MNSVVPKHFLSHFWGIRRTRKGTNSGDLPKVDEKMNNILATPSMSKRRLREWFGRGKKYVVITSYLKSFLPSPTEFPGLGWIRFSVI